MKAFPLCVALFADWLIDRFDEFSAWLRVMRNAKKKLKERERGRDLETRTCAHRNLGTLGPNRPLAESYHRRNNLIPIIAKRNWWNKLRYRNKDEWSLFRNAIILSAFRNMLLYAVKVKRNGTRLIWYLFIHFALISFAVAFINSK